MTQCIMNGQGKKDLATEIRNTGLRGGRLKGEAPVMEIQSRNEKVCSVRCYRQVSSLKVAKLTQAIRSHWE